MFGRVKEEDLMKILKLVMMAIVVVGMGVSASGCGKKNKLSSCDSAFLKCTDGGADVNTCKAAKDSCVAGGGG